MSKRLLYTLLLLTGVMLFTGCSTLKNTGWFSSGTVLTEPPQTIALLVPLQGQWSGAGEAVKNGFFSAYYADPNTGKAPNLNVYDTTQEGGVVAAYNKAIQDGANVVVGPLNKEDVKTLINSQHLSVPTLALNMLDDDSHTQGNLFQYGLSPIDEGQQAATKMINDGHRRILTITPQSAWGNSINQAFSQSWQSQDGVIVGTLSYNDQTNLTAAVGQLLNFKQSKKPDPKHPGRMLNLHDRREDFDAVFLVASPEKAMLIRPLLIFYYAGNIPVYSISSIYTGQVSANRSTDLDGIRFCDMPWVLETTLNITAARDNAEQLWPVSFSQNPKLYAMGIDAYTIVNRLNEFNSSSQYRVPGMTGLLSMNHRVIYRELDWALFEGGAPQLISVPQ